MARRSPLINVMVGAVMKAARNLRRDFGEVEQLQVSKKARPISCPPPISAPSAPSMKS